MTKTRLTIRMRLTLVYGAVFLVAGIGLLGVTYALVSQQSSGEAVNVTNILPGHLQSGVDGSGGISAQTKGQIIGQTRNQTLTAVLAQGGIALLLVGAVAVAVGWFAAGRLLHPLKTVTDAARRIGTSPNAGDGMHERIRLDGPQDEIKELADTFDGMLARLDESFDGQRRFIANASHELRTPLTVGRALIEVSATRKGASPEMQQLGKTLLEVNARHERLIDGLLLLARSDARLSDRSFVDLADVADHIIEQTPTAGITVSAELSEAPTSGNPVLLERLVQNLVENGVRHNLPEDGWVLVRTDTDSEGSAILEVSNSGPTLAPYDMVTIFEPFRRLGADRLATSPGAGLGLSIVRTIAQGHGGVAVAEPREGGGLVVRVTLPGQPYDGAEDSAPSV
jgi:signal transduction histidine kinase